MSTIKLIPIPNLPLIQPETDLGALLADSLEANNQPLFNEDVLVLAQKIVSKAENRFVNLNTVTPSARAMELAEATRKDPRQVEVVLWDTQEVIRTAPHVLIVEHLLGCISANAGLDGSNVARDDDVVLRLPADPDASARRIRHTLGQRLSVRPAVLIIDSHGRAWRLGTVGVVIGLAGLRPVDDLRGQPDLFGVPLKHTEVGQADQIAAAASLVMGQAAEATPAVIVRGLRYSPSDSVSARQILRPKAQDLFR